MPSVIRIHKYMCNLHNFPFWTTCSLLKHVNAAVQSEAHNKEEEQKAELLPSSEADDEVISLDALPCQLEHVHFVVAYLKYKCIPSPINQDSMYFSLTRAFDYLGCDEAYFQITLDDSRLNVFESVDLAINHNTCDLYQLYDDEQDGRRVQWQTVTPIYPYVVRPRRSFLANLPASQKRALRRIFGCIICKRRAFVNRVFHLFGKHLCVAGGSLHRAFRYRGASRACYSSSCDIDFFLLRFDFKTLEMFIHAFANVYQQYFGDYTVIRTQYAVTFFRVSHHHRNIMQIVLRSYNSVSHALSTFDLDASCIAYDGKNIVVNARGKRALQTGCNYVDITRQSTTFETRLCKYYRNYGLGIVVPHYDASRVSYSTIEDVATTGKHGLSRLLQLLLCQRENGTFANDRKRGGYGAFGQIAKSTSERSLIRNISIALSFNTYRTPFILRQNNSLVFEYFGHEKDLHVDGIDPGLLRDDFASTNGCFAPIEGPWYAEAYGGRNIPVWKQQIDNYPQMMGSDELVERDEWVVHVDADKFITYKKPQFDDDNRDE